MPIRPQDPDAWKRARSRILLAGEPNSRKTTSLLTWPRPLHVVMYPGEKGAASLAPDPQNGVNVYVWEQDPNPKQVVTSAMIVQEVKQATWRILAGEFGKVATFAGDGIHKLSDYIMDAVTQGEFLAGGHFEPVLWGAGRRELVEYVTKVQHSSVPNVVFTCWLAPEKDKPGERKGPAHVWPDLPGQLSKKVLGEFTAVVAAQVKTNPKNLAEPLWVWQIKPDSEVWGVGVKCPPAVQSKLPTFIPQDWGRLMALLDGSPATPSSPEPAVKEPAAEEETK